MSHIFHPHPFQLCHDSESHVRQVPIPIPKLQIRDAFCDDIIGPASVVVYIRDAVEISMSIFMYVLIELFYMIPDSGTLSLIRPTHESRNNLDDRPVSVGPSTMG